MTGYAQAKRLKDAGYEFEMNMFGIGELYDKMMALCVNLGVDDVVCMKGSVPNEQMVKEMSEHNIFLFTSDRNEGWGAVLNEAMSSGCAVVASNEIGSVPFLVKEGENGLIFKSKNLDSLYEKVVYLLENKEQIALLGRNAYYTMLNQWSPKIAAKNILQLIDDLKNGKDTSIVEGPCSKALPIKN
jgi:glycosyltransferase involved in cell wall biosynthesis